jgi:glycosyltransferase involved in cell wall biosynthesis
MYNEPQVSVVLPIYNGERYLVETLESILAQKYADYEIVAVNDGSRDQSAEVVKRYLSSGRIRYFEQPNRGVANARNAAIQCSTGRYIAFLDQDDLWLPGKLEKQVAYMQAHPEVALVHGPVECIDAEGTLISCAGRVYVDDAAGYCAEQLLVTNRIAVVAVMVRRSCLDAVGLLDQALAPADDWDLWLRLAVRFPFGFINEVLAKYRLHETNESKNTLTMTLAEVRVLESFRARYPAVIESADREAIDSTMVACYTRAAELLRQTGREREASTLCDRAQRLQRRIPGYYADRLARLFPTSLQPYVRWYGRRLGGLIAGRRDPRQNAGE